MSYNEETYVIIHADKSVNSIRPYPEEYDNEFKNQLSKIENSLVSNKIYTDYCEFNGIINLNNPEKNNDIKFRLKTGKFISKIRHINMTIDDYKIISMAFITNDNKKVSISISFNNNNNSIEFKCINSNGDYIDHLKMNNINDFDNIHWCEFDMLISIFSNYLMFDVLTNRMPNNKVKGKPDIISDKQRDKWINLLNSIKDK